MKEPVDILFGGQFGSEGKGVIAAALASDYDVHIRVGAPNAGHSFIGPDRAIWKMQTVPVGWSNPRAILIIGRGGLVNPRLLKREINAIADIDPGIFGRLIIDSKCGVLDNKFHELEGGIDGEMHKRIGSTGEGVGPAREARISRNRHNFRLFEDLAADDPWFQQFMIENTPGLINQMREEGSRVLIEGAQGQGLSMIHGPWPYCTSTDPGPAQMASDVGIPPKDLGKIIACFRTFPIRVAGNSGPLKYEISWDALSKKLGKEVIERTTVTKKVRRIGLWDDDLAIQCKVLHGPTEIALTFIDYLCPEDEGIDKYDELTDFSKQFIANVEQLMEVPVTMIGTGGPKLRIIRRSR